MTVVTVLIGFSDADERDRRRVLAYIADLWRSMCPDETMARETEGLLGKART